ncbi:hypothetical protein L1049_003156 [Liquidambar formosana]|uniref:PB1 domain-containing protein n=1 Tax=Liquidambar formosana TaxID=63359 RepID=A0AAP0NLY6_LIQFO
MDPPLSAAAAATATATTGHADHNTKLRLMCSYGGHIVPRPNSKTLCYIGGDTRIVAVDRRTTGTSLSSLTTHLSSTLLHTTTPAHRPFTIKYQLPYNDLDSLISLATDDDLHLMIDEYDRLSSPSPTATPSCRLRLFLFPSKPDRAEPALHDSPFDSWFYDALKSTKIMRRKERFDDSGSGFDSAANVEGQNEGLRGSGGEVKCGGDLCSLPESIVLETSSSFGSTSSSVSSSNLPPINVHVEDGGVNLLENMVKLPSPDSIVSENSVASAISHPQTGIYQDPVGHVASNPVESQIDVSNPLSGTQIHDSGYPISPQLVQQQQHQTLQFVPAGAHYMPHYPAGPLPISSYYPMYPSQLHQQQQTHYQHNQHYPIYLLPVSHTQPYGLSMQCNLVDIGNTASSRPSKQCNLVDIGNSVSSQPPMRANATTVPQPVAFKEVTTAPPVPVPVPVPVPESAVQVYPTTPLFHVPSNQNQQQLMDLPQMHNASQSIAISSTETAKYCNKVDDDPAYTQIYKSQPPAPSLSSQYQTMTQATAVMLSEALKRLHNDDTKQ